MALGGPAKLLKFYSTKDGKLEHSIKKHTDWITAVAFSPDGKYLASADRNGGILVGRRDRARVHSCPAKGLVTALAFMPGVLASASEDGKIALDVKEGKEIRSWPRMRAALRRSISRPMAGWFPRAATSWPRLGPDGQGAADQRAV